MAEEKRYKIVYCTPALYMAGGVERVLTLKANYFAEHFGYNITIILTEGERKPLFYPLSKKVNVVNLGIGFEELWNRSFISKVFVYLVKQYRFKKKLTAELMRLRPDITISLLRREINFINDIPDSSCKIGELHVNRAHYRNFEEKDANLVKNVFAKIWMRNLVKKLRKLDSLVVLTERDRETWHELSNVNVIPNPLSISPLGFSNLQEKRVISMGRYCHEKGYDYLLQAWAQVGQYCPEWRLDIFGDGDRSPYERMIDELHIDRRRCVLHGRTSDVQSEFIHSSVAVCSSRFEGFGMVIVEAMACGIPVVSFDCPWGPRSIISDGEDGLLVENGNVEKLSHTLILLLAQKENIVRLGSRARFNVQRFEIDTIAQKWKKLFEEVCMK